MAIDWITKAAEAIYHSAVYDEREDGPAVPSYDEMRKIISEHCPFKPDVAYMPVPRCETCRHWDVSRNYTYGGHFCALLERSTGSDFGCVQWEAK